MLNKIVISVIASISLLSCQNLQNAPTIDLGQKNWEVVRGQAVWKTHERKVSGDITLAINKNNDMYVEFLKTPVVIFSSQTYQNKWWVSTVEGKRYSGTGSPPKRIFWFNILKHLTINEALPKGWVVNEKNGSKRFINTEKNQDILVVLDEY